MADRSPADANQPILGHLNELRIRLTWAVVGLVVATVLSFTFTRNLLTFLIEPYGEQLQTLSPTEGIETYFRVALVSGAVISMPWILYQVWRFIEPGLEEREKRYVYLFVPSATLLFLTGVAFSWLILLPAAIDFLGSFLPTVFSPEWTSQEYIGFATTFMFWLGVSFEMPLVLYFLARFGIVSSQMLREHWRYAIVGIAVIAAAVTPSIDPVTMLLTMAPLIVLYGLSIILARIGQGQFEKVVQLDQPAENGG
jgi:sec-independent protein translocase protein TatC